MFERFTDRARRVVALAQDEARRLEHDHIGTEHILLGLLREERGMAVRVLTDLGVAPVAVRARILEAVGAGQTAPTGHIPFTPRAKKVLELSLREALWLGTNHIGTEHVLLGLIHEGEGAGARVLAGLGVVIEPARAAVVAIYERGTGDEDQERAPAPGQAGERRVIRGTVRGYARRLPGSAFAPSVARFPVRLDDPVVPREAEAARLLTVLARRERNNALIVGPAGAGKSALVREVAQLFSAERGPFSLGDAEVVQFDLIALYNRSGLPAVRPAGSVVVVEDLDALLAGDEASGGRLVPGLAVLAESASPFIVTATDDGRDRLASRVPTLAARFDTVALPAAGRALTLEVLRALRPRLGEFHRVGIADDALDAAAELGARDPGGRGRVLPGAAVDLLDAAAAQSAASRETGAGRQAAVLDAERVRAQYQAEAG